MRHWVLSFFFFLGLIAASPSRAWSQASQLDNGPAPPPGADAATPSAETSPEASATPAAPVWDPLRAAKSMEVGAYYLRTGKYDAAIDRFQEAGRVQPGLAKPFLLLGRAYEKKKDPKSAVSAYQKYLQLYPTAPDRAEVLKDIARLNSHTPKQITQSSSR